MEDFLRFLLTPLLSLPDKLTIKSTAYSMTISVDGADMGRVIGHGGGVISAIRNLTRAYAVIHQLPITSITVTEPPGGYSKGDTLTSPLPDATAVNDKTE